MATVVVTDTSSDITPTEARRLGIELIPLYVHMGGKKLRDGYDIDAATFFARMAADKELPKSEPASVDDFVAVFTRLTSAGNDVVCSLVSKALSETYNNASKAAEKFPGKVFVLDTKAGSGLLMLMTMYAAELAAAGAKPAEIIAKVDRTKLKGQAYFVMSDVTFLGRTGRLPKAVVALGSMLNVSLILRLDENGGVAPAGQTRNFEKSQEMMVDVVIRHLGDGARPRCAVQHANAPEAAKALHDLLVRKLPSGSPDPIMATIGATTSANLGPGTLGVTAIVV
ncbi:MAG: DegV family protein [Vulcanimicrobiaceae bacterium]